VSRSLLPAASARSPSQPLLRSRLGQHGLLLGAYAAARPDGHHARGHQWLQLALHLSRCFRSRLGQHGGRCSAHTRLIAQMGVTLAAASSFSSLSISAAAFVFGLGSTGCCSARTRLIAQTGVTLAAPSGFSSLSISAAAFVLGLGGTGCCSAHAAVSPARHDARRNKRLQLVLHLSR